MSAPNTWQVQEAKNRFSEVLDLANKKGPQIVTRHGEEVGVVISMEEYRKAHKPKESLYDFLRRSPLRGVKLDLKRSRGPERGTPIDFDKMFD